MKQCASGYLCQFILHSLFAEGNEIRGIKYITVFPGPGKQFPSEASEDAELKGSGYPPDSDERRKKVFRKEDMFRLEQQLTRIVKGGAKLYLEGEIASAQEVAWACMVNEEAVYMPDYVLDESGRIAELRYDRVRQI